MVAVELLRSREDVDGLAELENRSAMLRVYRQLVPVENDTSDGSPFNPPGEIPVTASVGVPDA